MRSEEPGDEQRQPPQGDRDSIWSIPLARRALYFGLFTLYALAGICFLIWYHVFERRTDTWQETILSIIQGIGVTTVGAAGLALLTIEGPRTVMVVADYITQRWLNPLKERLREEGRAEGRAQGRAEAEAKIHAEWEAWNERRMAAEAAGEPFDEPPPGTSSSEGK